MQVADQPLPVFTDDFVLIANTDRRPCRNCGQIHPYISHADSGRRLSCSAPAVFARRDAEQIEIGDLVDLPVSPIT